MTSLSLVQLTDDEIARIVATVPGGAPNIQDVYPLAPLQGGVLFHHLLDGAGDPYLMATLFSFDSRERLDRYVCALRAVVARHDLLRTSVLWEGLREPLQVVYCRVELPVEEVTLDPQDGDVAGQLSARFDPRRFRIDLRLAPMLRVYVTPDHVQQRWLLLFLRHHLTGDQASFALMQEEIEAHLLGRADALPEPLPFRNFMGRFGVSVEDHEAYFRELLGDVQEPTAPFELIDVRRDGTGMAQASRAVDPSLAQRLRDQARRLGVFPSSLCHVAWGLVLARVCGRHDAVFGTVLLGRMQAGEAAHRVMGMFINTLPVRIRLGESPVGAIVRETHRQLSRLLRHEQASLALAQRCSRVPAPAPLFSALLNYRRDLDGVDVQPERSPAWEGIRTLSAEQHTNYPLTLTIDDQREGFHLTVEVDSSVDPERICGYMHQALESLVEALESGSERPARTLQVLPDSERDEVLFRWNAKVDAYPQEHGLDELFAAQVRRTPTATAVEQAGTALTYAELQVQANRLAHYLRTRGVGPDQRVAVCVAPGLDMVVALLGVLKTGGACVPLDPAWAADRLRFVLDDSAPVALLTGLHRERLVAAVPDTVAIIDIDAARAASSDYPATDPERGDLAWSDLAYLIYTDVSADMPSGVMIEHGNVARLSTLISTSTSTRCASFTDANVSLWEMWGALLSGGRLIVADSDGSAETMGLGFCRVLDVTDANCVEGASTSMRVSGASAYILDGDGLPAPVGVVADVYVGGGGVARGYWRRPERTARLYRTGHRGKWLPDGTIALVARTHGAAAPGDPAAAGSAIAAYEAPAGEMESTVARIWAEVLKVKRVGRWDNFFELNGHSLLAVQIVARLRQELGVEVGLEDLLDQPVLAAFVERLVGLQLEQFDAHDLGAVLKLIREGV
jgi:non-ribosomal peptide synthetase component F/acyl carrier protein